MPPASLPEKRKQRRLLQAKFRHRQINLLKRANELSSLYEANVYVVIYHQARYYTYKSTESLTWPPSEEDIERHWLISEQKLKADFEWKAAATLTPTPTATATATATEQCPNANGLLGDMAHCEGEHEGEHEAGRTTGGLPGSMARRCEDGAGPKMTVHGRVIEPADSREAAQIYYPAASDRLRSSLLSFAATRREPTPGRDDTRAGEMLQPPADCRATPIKLTRIFSHVQIQIQTSPHGHTNKTDKYLLPYTDTERPSAKHNVGT